MECLYMLLGVLFGLLSACTYSFFLFAAGKVKTNLHGSMKSAVLLTEALPVLSPFQRFRILKEQVLPLQWVGMGFILLGIVVSEIRSAASVQRGSS